MVGIVYQVAGRTQEQMEYLELSSSQLIKMATDQGKTSLRIFLLNAWRKI